MTNKERFLLLCKQVARRGMDDVVEYLEGSDFFTAPASTRFHESYEGGLCEHSLNVYDRMKDVLVAFPEIKYNVETVIIVSLFHDLCKVNMYKTEKRNRKNEYGKWEQYDAYTIDEKFSYGGHGSKSVFILSQFIKLTPEEAVAINCHMGSWDGNKEVSNAYEQYPLAWALHVADEAATFIKKEN